MTHADTILWLGDSRTFGMEASDPSQWERLLQARWPKRDIRVIDAGALGFSSTQVLKRLPAYLQEIHPALVLLLVGSNDMWNFTEVDLSSLKVLEATRLVRFQRGLDRVLAHSRLYYLVTRLIHPRSPGDEAWALSDPALAAVSAERLFTQLRVVLRAYPKWAQALLRAAGEDSSGLSGHQQRQRAMQVVQEAWQGTTVRLKSLLQLGHLLRLADRNQLAIQMYQRALEIDPDHKEALLGLDAIYRERQEVRRAQPVYEQLIKQDPSNPRYHLWLGRFYLSHGDLDQASASLYTTIALDPESLGGYLLLGHVFLSQKRLAQAQAMFLHAVELHPSCAWCWFALGRVSQEMGQIEQARRAWQEGFRLSQDLGAFVNLSQSYGDPVEREQAVRLLLDRAKASLPQANPSSWKPFEWLLAHDLPMLPQRLLEANLEQIVEQLTAQGIQIGFLTYPGLPKDSPVNQTIRDVAARYPRVLLIDVAQTLETGSATHARDLIEVDSGQPHATDDGLLARHVLQALVTSGVLDGHGQGSL